MSLIFLGPLVHQHIHQTQPAPDPWAGPGTRFYCHLPRTQRPKCVSWDFDGGMGTMLRTKPEHYTQGQIQNHEYIFTQRFTSEYPCRKPLVLANFRRECLWPDPSGRQSGVLSRKVNQACLKSNNLVTVEEYNRTIAFCTKCCHDHIKFGVAPRSIFSRKFGAHTIE